MSHCVTALNIQRDRGLVFQHHVNVLTISAFPLRQDLLPAVSNSPPWKYPLQEEDLQGRFHRHLQPRGPAHRLRAARGEQTYFTSKFDYY